VRACVRACVCVMFIAEPEWICCSEVSEGSN